MNRIFAVADVGRKNIGFGIGRPVLFLLSIYGGVGSYLVSFIETAGFVLGTFIFLHGQIKERPA